ncbi:hypothetical protein Gpo141_00003102, partial [Globisporangium polare]
STFHYATFDYLPGNRHAVRVTTQAERPYQQQAASSSKEGEEEKAEAHQAAP